MEDTWFEGATLDRVNNKLAYNKKNCQWLSKSDHSKKTAYDVKYMKKELR